MTSSLSGRRSTRLSYEALSRIRRAGIVPSTGFEPVAKRLEGSCSSSELRREVETEPGI